MNLILLEDIESLQENVKIEGRQFLHVKKILKGKVGDKIKIGKINSLIGIGLITKMTDNYLEITIIELNKKPPSKNARLSAVKNAKKDTGGTGPRNPKKGSS